MPESVSFVTNGTFITEQDFFQCISQQLSGDPRIITYIGTHHPMRQNLAFQNGEKFTIAMDSSHWWTVGSIPEQTKLAVEEVVSHFTASNNNHIEHVHVFFDNLTDNNAMTPCTYYFSFYVLIM